MQLPRAVIVSLMTVGLGISLTACDRTETSTTTVEPTKTTKDVEVKDRLLGGKEVKETEVIEQGDKTQVRERKTKTDNDGNVTEKKVEIKGDQIK